MGFKKIYISKFHKEIDVKSSGIEIIKVGKIEHLVRSLFS